MCTRCPVPCQECRAGGTGAFCGKTPCECQCHDPRRVRESLDAHAAGYAAAVADVVADLITQGVGLNLMGKRQMSKYVASLVVKYSSGAHVGAAKKGAT